MSSSIDSRVVQLKFDNSAFQSAATSSLTTLDKLKKSLDFSTSTKSLDGLSSSVSRFNLGPIGTSIEGASAKFMALATIGVTALARITTKAMQTGEALVKSLTIDPISSGFAEYELKLGSIQTIMAGSGEKLKTVNKYLSELNTYSDKTIYSFKDMTSNIGKFTNAGVDLKTSVAAIQGIANVAAISGANAEEASRAMYNFAQSLSSGSVKLMDWKSIELANMATKGFKTELLESAVAAGKLTKTGEGMYKTLKGTPITATKGFNESLNQQWLTSEALIKTLGRYADANTAIGKKATAAATQVKTFSQLMDTLKESVGSGWAQTFELLVGNFNQAKTLWTSVNNVIGGVIGKSSDARNTLLADWANKGGRKIGIEALKNAFAALNSVIQPIKEAFRQLFPPTTGRRLVSYTQIVRDFFASLKMGAKEQDLIKRTFAGFFAILSIGKQILGGIITMFKTMFASAAPAAGGFLTITANIGDMLVSFNNFLKKSGAITKFFTKLGEVLQIPLKFLGAVTAGIAGLFSSGTVSGISNASGAFSNLSGVLGVLNPILDGLKKVWESFVDAFRSTFPYISQIGEQISAAFSGTGQSVGDALKSINWEAVFKGALIGIGAIFTGSFAKLVFGGLKVKFGGSMLDSLADSLDTLSGTLKAYQNQLKAKTLMMIAGAILALAVALKVLASIDPGDMAKATAGLTVLFAELLTSMKILSGISSSKGFLKIPLIASSLILLSVALVFLAGAVKIMSTMDLSELIQGLFGVGVVLKLISNAITPLTKNVQNMFAVGAGLIMVGISLNIIALAVRNFAAIETGDMLKGLVGIGGALAAIGGALRTFPTESVIQMGFSLILVSVALILMSDAIKKFGQIEFGDMVKGIVGLAVVLLLVSVAMDKMKDTSWKSQASLVLVAYSLQKIADVISIFGAMNLKELTQGLVAFAVMLGVLAGALWLMQGTQSSAVALIVTAGALLIMAMVLKSLADIGPVGIAIGIVALAAALVVIAGASVLLAPAVPAIMALGIAIAILGAGIALIGVGILAFAAGMMLLVQVGNAGTEALNRAIDAVISVIPKLFEAFKQALIAFAGAIKESAPALIDALTTVLSKLLDAIVKLVPKALKTLGVLLDAMLKFMIEYFPKLWMLGPRLINGFIKELTKSVPDFAKSGTDLILAFMKGISDNVPRIVAAAYLMIIDTLNGISKAINDNSEAVGQAGADLGLAMIRGIAGAITGAAKRVWEAMAEVARSAIQWAKDILGIHSPSREFQKIGAMINAGLILGIVGGKEDVQRTITNLIGTIKAGMENSKADIEKYKKELARLNSQTVTKANQKKHDLMVKEAKANLARAQSEYNREKIAYHTVTKEMKKNYAALRIQGAKYDSVMTALDAKQKILEDKIKERDDFAASIKDQYSKLPEIEKDTSLEAYFKNIRDTTAANEKFKASLDRLRAMGMDDVTYKKLLAEGTDIQPFLDQLEAAGPAAVKELARIDAALTKSATDLGNKAAKDMYQAGVDLAQGAVDGLVAKKKVIEKEMKRLGKLIADALKKELGIHSPSKVMEEVGKNTVLGLANGVDKYAKVVDISTARVGDKAVSRLKKTMAGLGDAVNADVDINPTIAPVLDLNQFRKDAKGMSDILAPGEIVPDLSAKTASGIAAKAAEVDRIARAAEATKELSATGTTIEYNQVINAPKALTPAEIYRQTKNGLAVVKGAMP